MPLCSDGWEVQEHHVLQEPQALRLLQLRPQHPPQLKWRLDHLKVEMLLQVDKVEVHQKDQRQLQPLPQCLKQEVHLLLTIHLLIYRT